MLGCVCAGALRAPELWEGETSEARSKFPARKEGTLAEERGTVKCAPIHSAPFSSSSSSLIVQVLAQVA